jgi:hypothetical protein
VTPDWTWYVRETEVYHMDQTGAIREHTLGEFLHELRARRRLTRADVERLNPTLTQAMTTRWEWDKRAPDPVDLRDLVTTLGYGETILAHCLFLRSFPRGVRQPRRYWRSDLVDTDAHREAV